MYYFAYASNLNRKQMAERCPDSRPLFVATLPNHKLIFAGWNRRWRGPTASIKPSQGEKVIGAVYDISPRDLRSLDKHEDSPATYNRVTKMVFVEDGERVEAVTYVKREQSDEGRPSPEYAAVIRQGYRDWHIVED